MLQAQRTPGPVLGILAELEILPCGDSMHMVSHDLVLLSACVSNVTIKS
jgi:hypothetical protein